MKTREREHLKEPLADAELLLRFSHKLLPLREMNFSASKWRFEQLFRTANPASEEKEAAAAIPRLLLLLRKLSVDFEAFHEESGRKPIFAKHCV